MRNGIDHFEVRANSTVNLSLECSKVRTKYLFFVLFFLVPTEYLSGRADHFKPSGMVTNKTTELKIQINHSMQTIQTTAFQHMNSLDYFFVFNNRYKYVSDSSRLR